MCQVSCNNNALVCVHICWPHFVWSHTLWIVRPLSTKEILNRSQNSNCILCWEQSLLGGKPSTTHKHHAMISLTSTTLCKQVCVSTHVFAKMATLFPCFDVLSQKQMIDSFDVQSNLVRTHFVMEQGSSVLTCPKIGSLNPTTCTKEIWVLFQSCTRAAVTTYTSAWKDN